MVNPEVKVGFSMHLVNKETSEVEERPVSVKLPKWMWDIIQSRASYCHDNNVNEAFGEVLAMGLLYLKDKITVSETDVPNNPNAWN